MWPFKCYSFFAEALHFPLIFVPLIFVFHILAYLKGHVLFLLYDVLNLGYV